MENNQTIITIDEARVWLNAQDPIFCEPFLCIMPRRDCGKRWKAANARNRYWSAMHQGLPQDKEDDVRHIAAFTTLYQCWRCEEGKKNATASTNQFGIPARKRFDDSKTEPPLGKVGMPLRSFKE